MGSSVHAMRREWKRLTWGRVDNLAWYSRGNALYGIGRHIDFEKGWGTRMGRNVILN